MSDSRQTFAVIAAAAYGYFTQDWGTAFKYATVAYGLTQRQPTAQLEGPRVTDFIAAPSQYGVGVPKTWGADRVACTPIWQQEIQETATTESSGGKGGGGGANVTTYSYSQSFAVLIGEGEIKGIRRMWADTKLVYDARAGVDAETAQESARFRQYFELYRGTEDQDPDSTIESIDGAGKVPAYRGSAYIVFTSLPLADYGNRQPVISVEVSSVTEEEEIDGIRTEVTEREPLFVYRWDFTQELTTAPWRQDIVQPVHSLGDTMHDAVNQPGITSTTSFAATASEQAASFGVDGAHTRPEAGLYSSQRAGRGYWYSGTNSGWHIELGGATLGDNPEYLYYLASAYEPQSGPQPYVGFNTNIPQRIHTSIRPEFVGLGADSSIFWRIEQPNGIDTEGPPVGYSPIPWTQDVYMIDTIQWINTTWSSYLLTLRGKRVPYHPPRTCRPGSPFTNPEGTAVAQGGSGWCVLMDGEVVPNRIWTAATGTAKQLCAIEYRNGKLYQNARGPVLLPADPNYSNSAYWDALAAAAMAVSDPNGTLAQLPGTASNAMRSDVTYPVVVTDWYESDTSEAEAWDMGESTDDDNKVLLSVIVSDICVEAGLTTGQIDVTELTDLVLGYTRTNRMAARAALEPLRMAYLFDAVESGSKIVFRKRGRAVTSTIDADDLGAGVDNPLTERMQVERGQEAELPQALAVQYKDIDLDYQPGIQEEPRSAGGSDQQAVIEIPVVLTADHARQLAAIWLFDAWQSRTRRNVATTLAYAEIEPTDVIEVDDGDA